MRPALWFAFEIYIFDILIQLILTTNILIISCDLLSKFISLIFWYNLEDYLKDGRVVVICFRNLYLWYSDTTGCYHEFGCIMLWFAFEIYIFDILIQQVTGVTKVILVVICFRNLYLWYSDTTSIAKCRNTARLWFAFEIYIFDILIQPNGLSAFLITCCDLLSKFISLIFWYNKDLDISVKEIVVICFRNLYLWYSDTTALKAIERKISCDLLSKFISLIFWYNNWYTIPYTDTVVICFRNLYLWYSDTTCRTDKQICVMLWFAFEIYIFDILIQQTKKPNHDEIVVICFRNLYLWYSDTTNTNVLGRKLGCDLLSKFISLIFWYNTKLQTARTIKVVICFRNLYLWYSDTTYTMFDLEQFMLWFAFEIYIFDILIQQNEGAKGLISRCDLLSKFISLIFWYNHLTIRIQRRIVVICFRNLYLWYSDTTLIQKACRERCCDLLSKFISLIFWYNFR